MHERIVFMKLVTVAITALLAVTFNASADTYQWVDNNGVVHFTDDPDRIPDKYLKKVKRRPSEKPAGPSSLPAINTPTPAVQGTSASGEKEQTSQKDQPIMYGSHDASWWRSRFTDLRAELKNLEDSLPRKRDEQQALHRFRVIYKRAKDREAINELNTQIEKDEARIGELRKQLADLEIEANKAGVPLELRQ